ncbi:MAG TPA: hypothetical protein VFH68_23160 [Polyangia bacterium]|jgi:hypothetical protein|nr:hypothetical protein [Polyangia bacterium]
MSEKLVLPRFDLPRDSTRIAIRALWAAGGLVVVATLVLGMAMWHRRSVEIATAERAAAARLAAMTPPPPITPAKLPAVAPVALAGTGETTMAAVVPATSSEPGRRSAPSHSRHGGKSPGHARSGPRGSASTAARPASAVTARKSKVDDDFIDKLLSK